MPAWETKDMAEALNADVQATEGAVTSEAPVPLVKRDAQSFGWQAKQAYDYDTYNKTGKQLLDEAAAVGILSERGWASNAAKYEWDDEYGDVGPAFPELEKQLFGSEHHVRAGIQFDKIKMIEVVQESPTKIQPIRSFEDAGLHPVMLANVKLAGYDIPTPIQAYCLPAILKGHDVVACAQTGSGKTAAFLVPTLSKLMGKAKKLCAKRPNPATFREGVDRPVRAEPLLVVVCPSRELATQIFDEARRFCYRSMLRPCVLYGGGPVVEQMMQLQKGCDVLIATPGRLCDFIDRPHVLSLNRLKYMIIDEADEMLNSEWDSEMKKIMSGGDQEEGNITYMMFSATFPKSARDLAKEHLAHDHIRIRVGRAGSSHVNIQQSIVYVEPAQKRTALLDLLYATPPARTIIFVNAKRAADELDDYLYNQDFPCTSIHSGRTQREREDALRAFRTGKTPILVATGVSARGLDLRNVLRVVNFDLPSVSYGGIEEYTHRIGRTGRIGNIGVATSFYNDRDVDIAEVLVKTLLETGQEIPDFLEQFRGEEGVRLKFDADSDDDEGGGNNGGDGAVANPFAPTEIAPVAPALFMPFAQDWAPPAALVNQQSSAPAASAYQPAAPVPLVSQGVAAHPQAVYQEPIAPTRQQPVASMYQQPTTSAYQHPVAPVTHARQHPAAPVTQAYQQTATPVAVGNHGWPAPTPRGIEESGW